MQVRALRWQGGVDGHLELVDQTLLPGEYVWIKCTDVQDVYDAICRLAVRGAPAIGVAAGFGMVLGLAEIDREQAVSTALEQLGRAGDYLKSSRPTAVNLAWAVDRILRSAHRLVAQKPDTSVRALAQATLETAQAICDEDQRMCRAIGQNGADFIQPGSGVLTHCNAGALATAGQGTALSVLFEAHRRGKRFRAYADETRPLLQGARLSAWELSQAGIDVTVLCDNMAGWLMKQGLVDLVIVGADRIAANGDTANKIGTYSLSVLAGQHGVKFYVAAPSSTFDMEIAAGDAIPIEQRGADELRYFNGRQITPTQAKVYNPAFDVTPAGNITAIITEKGVIERPSTETVREILSTNI